MSTVAVLGLGAMGVRMAKNLLKAGHGVVVWNRTKERARQLELDGATVADSPREAAQKADIVISMVTDEAASRAVWLEGERCALRGLRDGAIAIESSTLTPSWIKELSVAISGQGARFLDAPVVGSTPQAEAAQLTYLVGGAKETVDEARGVLSAMGSAIHHVGPVGAGMVMKLGVNALFGIQVAAVSEVLGMMAKSGVEEAKSIELLGAMPITSPALKRVLGLIGSRSFSPYFPIRLVEKDFRYIVDSAERVNASAATARAVRDLYALASQKGHGDDDISGIAQLFL